MRLNTINVADLIVHRDIGHKVAAIVATATADTSLTGEALWQSLVYTGVSLGAEETQTHFIEHARGVVQLLRGLLSRIEVARTMTKDEDARKCFDTLAENVGGALKDRARMLTSLHVRAACEMYGIEEEVLTGSTEPENLSPTLLAQVGHLAHRKAPEYFVCWSMGVRKETLPKLRCKCSSCLRTLVTEDTSEEGEVSAASKHFGGLDNTFAAFGLFLLSECRDSLFREMEGLQDPHDGFTGGPGDDSQGAALAKSLMAKFTGNNAGKRP